MSDINPYVPPAVPDPLLAPQSPGGAWRDGPFLVVHRLGATLPHICLRTGTPAVLRRSVTIKWSYPIDVSTRTTAVDVGLSGRAARMNRRLELGGNLASGAGIVAGAVALYAAEGMTRPIFTIVFLPFFILFAGGLIASDRARLLRFWRARGEYLWLKGASEPLLDHLPAWPGVR
jgi:hypothetical protein